jgi:hypothetical protein
MPCRSERSVGPVKGLTNGRRIHAVCARLVIVLARALRQFGVPHRDHVLFFIARITLLADCAIGKKNTTCSGWEQEFPTRFRVDLAR